MKNVKSYIPVFLVLALSLSMVGCVSESPANLNNTPAGGAAPASSDYTGSPAAPHVPVNNAPRVKIAEQTWEYEGQIMSGGKTFAPLEFDSDPQLHEIKNTLPVITFYPFDMTTLEGTGWNTGYFYERNTPKHGVVFTETPESVLYTLFDEDLEVVSVSAAFEFPVEIGDYILRIDVFETAYYIRIVVGEPRGWCDRIDRYHGGGEGFKVYDFDSILEMRTLLDKDDQAIADYFKAICDREDGRRWECPCFIRTKTDLQSFFSWLKLDRIQLPFSQTATLDNILLRDSYADIYVRYMIDDMLFNFLYYPDLSYVADEDIEGIRDNGIAQWSVDYLTTVGDVNIFTHRIIDHFEIANFQDQPEDPQVIFILNVNGTYVNAYVSIECADPATCKNGWDFGSGHSCNGEWVDRQAAIDGIMQFEFKILF